MAEEKTHYSKEELEEFRQIINKKLESAREEYSVYKESIDAQSESASDMHDVTEHGADMADKEYTEYLLSRTSRFIRDLERALVRIENGSYGRDKDTGQLIPKERLRVVPHTESTVQSKLNRGAR